jgi:hypothetical protein
MDMSEDVEKSSVEMSRLLHKNWDKIESKYVTKLCKALKTI